MREVLQNALDTIETIPPSDTETISKVRQAVAERALYFADEDLDLTRRESNAVRADIYERYNTRERFDEAMVTWSEAYEGFTADFKSYSGRALSKPPTLDDFAAHHVNIAELEATYHTAQHSGRKHEAHLILAPVVQWETWKFMFNVRYREDLILDTAMRRPDTEKLPVWAENNNTITHNGQLWTLTISSLGREEGKDEDTTPLPELSEFFALLMLRKKTISMPQLTVAPDAMRTEQGDVTLDEDGKLKTIIVDYDNDKKTFRLYEERLGLIRDDEDDLDETDVTQAE